MLDTKRRSLNGGNGVGGGGGGHAMSYKKNLVGTGSSTGNNYRIAKTNSNTSGPSIPNNTSVNSNFNVNNDNREACDEYDYDYMEEGVFDSSSDAPIDVCDMWYKKENAMHRRLRIFFMEFFQALWYNTIVGIGFRMVGNSWSFGLLQGFAFTSMVGLFWYEDFGFANIFLTMGLCFMRQLRSREYWIFLIHLAGQLLGGLLAMAGIVLITNDLPGIQTFGTPTKSALITETSAGFSEFIGSFFVAILVFMSVSLWNEAVKPRFSGERTTKEKRRQKRHYNMPNFTIVLGLAYTALSIGFYDLTGSSFNFLRWALPRLCMGNFNLNPHDALYYLVANFIAITLAGIIVFLFMLYKRRVEKAFLKTFNTAETVTIV